MRFAAGWLGWTEDKALEADVQYLLAAYRGRVEMFKMLFGSRETEPKKKKVTAAEIKTFVKHHNILAKAGKMKIPKGTK